jgi:16S rRNA C1402 (ribose-2'-O) methylase RsmI
VCLELSKRFERVHRGWLADLAAEFDGRQEKGEITVVIAGNNPKFLRTHASAEMEER